jgi:hypothetical protein
VKRRPLIVLYARHFCVRCDQRVFPYDSFEKRTEAPKLGARARKVLLFSANSQVTRNDPDNPARTAWCWNCNRWTTTYRETYRDIERRYAARKGVSYRPQPVPKRQAKILQLRKRRSA